MRIRLPKPCVGTTTTVHGGASAPVMSCGVVQRRAPRCANTALEEDPASLARYPPKM